MFDVPRQRNNRGYCHKRRGGGKGGGAWRDLRDRGDVRKGRRRKRSGGGGGEGGSHQHRA